MEGGGSRELEASETEKLRASMQDKASAQVDFARPELFALSPPLEIEVQGQDLETLQKAGGKLAAMLRAKQNEDEVQSSVESGDPEIQIVLEQERAAALSTEKGRAGKKRERRGGI